MPGWHERTRELQRQGRLQLAGIIQEQHPDRCRLFMQWKQMDWPILVDSLNLYGVSAVPLTYAIDEAGIVRLVSPKPEELEAFVATSAPAQVAPAAAAQPDLDSLQAATHAGSAEAWRALGDALFLWGGESRLGDAVAAYERALRLGPAPATEFRLGVALRARHDSAARTPGDFQRAAEHWAAALEQRPEQYVWRRRIQQFGPRLDKPYPFYDWIEEARAAIRARGDTPSPLMTEASGAEIAAPSERFAGSAESPAGPDPRGRVSRDAAFIRIDTAAVPPRIAPGGVTRVHVSFRPNVERRAHWNNEAEPLRAWLQPPSGWSVDARESEAAQPPEEVSTELRELQFEVKAPQAAAAAPVTIPGYALYYVCEKADGTCLYRRQDFRVRVVVRAGKAAR